MNVAGQTEFQPGSDDLPGILLDQHGRPMEHLGPNAVPSELRRAILWLRSSTMKKHCLWIAGGVILAGPAFAQIQSGTTETSKIAPLAVASPQQFAEKAAVSNMFEIESSKLAEQKGQQDAVKKFAQRMVADHTKAGEQMKTAAQADGITSVPTQLDQEHKAKLDQLNAASGAEFDRLYTQMQRQAHEEAIAMFKGFAGSGGNTKLGQFAEATLPTLEQHYAAVSGSQ